MFEKLLSLLLSAVAVFCAYGFLASFEPTESALAFRVGYGVAGALCLFGSIRLLIGRRAGRAA